MLLKGRTAIEGLSGSSSTAALTGGSAGGSARVRPVVQFDPIDLNGLLDVLDLLRSQILKIQANFAFDAIENSAGNADAAGIGESFQACGDVDAIAVNVRALDDDVAQIDADAQPDAPVIGYIGLTLGHLLLNIDGALDGLYHTGKLGQEPIAHQLHAAQGPLFLRIGLPKWKVSGRAIRRFSAIPRRRA
jgi:hypothetical protein